MSFVLGFLQKIGYTQQGNINRGGVVPGPVPTTFKAAEPGTRIQYGSVKGWGGIRLGRLSTLRAGVRGASGVLPGEVHPCQMAFVAQASP